MFFGHRLKRSRIVILHTIKNCVKRAQFYLFGFRAHSSTSIAWTVSADGGGAGGRILVGKGSILDSGVILRANGSSILIGENCSVNPYSIIQGCGGVKIGNGVRIASHVAIIAANHIFDDTSRFIYLQGESGKGVIIEDDVWIGAGSTILDGVVVRKGTVVGAGAVVTKSTDQYSIVIGAPARAVRNRKQ